MVTPGQNFPGLGTVRSVAETGAQRLSTGGLEGNRFLLLESLVAALEDSDGGQRDASWG